MIVRETVRWFFRNNREKGGDLDRDMLWGFFLLGRDREQLGAVVPELEADGYKYIDVLSSEEEEPPVFYLHLEIVETHSASLYARVQELDGWARKRGLPGLDGFEVGNVDGSILRQ